jgi:tripartite-type tricarboxylate transporter receptor subunit TctC
MKLHRRQLVKLLLTSSALPASSFAVLASDYPTRPVHLVVGFFAGGLTDILTRVLGESLSQRLGQQFAVEDQPGAGTNIATARVIRSSPDGYTMLMATSSNAINASLYTGLNFDFIRDTAPVASIARTPMVMTVSRSFAAKTVAEFIAYAKSNPAGINMATAGKGSSVHLAGELFMNMTGVKMTIVHYRESYIPDMLAGRMQVVFSPIPTIIEQIRAGKLRALAVTSAAPSPALPGVPTIAESVPGFDAVIWNGMVAPKGTPPDVIDKLNHAITAGLTDPYVMSKFANAGSTPKTMTPGEFGKFVVEDTAKWSKIIRAANIRVG